VKNVNESNLPELRRLARELGVSPAALRDALECGLFVDDESPAAWAGALLRMRGLMDAVGVNAPGAALLVRMQRDLQVMQRQLQRLRRLEASWFEEWDDGLWHDLTG
jgi:hypothetical protein